jgi:hypothetical protein
MQIATYTKTGKAVQILTVSRGWVRIRQHDKKEVSVRSTEVTDVHEAAALPVAKAKAPKEPKAKKEIDINNRKNGVVDSLYLPQYIGNRVTRSDGTLKRALDCGDEVAAKLRAMTIEEVYAFAARVLKVSDGGKALKAKYEGLNVGMQRMNLGNSIRKALRNA